MTTSSLDKPSWFDMPDPEEKIYYSCVCYPDCKISHSTVLVTLTPEEALTLAIRANGTSGWIWDGRLPLAKTIEEWKDYNRPYGAMFIEVVHLLQYSYTVLERHKI
jgi:hypothetical protein